MLYTVSVGPLALNIAVYMMQYRRGIIHNPCIYAIYPSISLCVYGIYPSMHL